MPVSLETLDTSKILYSQLEILMVFKFGGLAPSEIYRKHLFDWFIVDVLAAIGASIPNAILTLYACSMPMQVSVLFYCELLKSMSDTHTRGW